MRILIIGNKNHQLLGNLFALLKSDTSHQFDILSTANDKKYDSDTYDSIFENIFKISSSHILYKYGLRFNTYYRHTRFKKHFKTIDFSKYDFIHIHYIENIILQNIDLVLEKIKCSKLIITIWGSDFYKSNKQTKEIIKRLLDSAYKITVPNPEGKNNILSYYQDKKLEDKIHFAIFHLQPLSVIKYTKLESKDCKRNLNIPKDKIAIAVGYNRSINQQHIDICKNIVENEYLRINKDRIHFLFPITYPNNVKYLNTLKSYLCTFPFTYTLFTDFMSNKEIAYLRKASDIMIQLQKTDMMSGSMTEHLYANNIVITGKWLDYKLYKSWGLQYFEIDLLQNIQFQLEYCLQNYNKIENKIKINESIIDKYYSENKIRNQWLSIYCK